MKNLGKKSVLIASIAVFSFGLNMSYAQDNAAAKAPKVQCTLSDQEPTNSKASEPKDTFDVKTEALYVVCVTEGLKKGQSLTAQWVAADTHNVIPANTKVQETTLKVPDTVKEDEPLPLEFNLKRTSDTWPAGRYHVDFYVDDQQNSVQSIDFTVSANKTTE